MANEGEFRLGLQSSPLMLSNIREYSDSVPFFLPWYLAKASKKRLQG
jgi:hypothetical protein